MDILIGSVNRFTNSPQFSKWIVTRSFDEPREVKLFRKAFNHDISWGIFLGNIACRQTISITINVFWIVAKFVDNPSHDFNDRVWFLFSLF